MSGLSSKENALYELRGATPIPVKGIEESPSHPHLFQVRVVVYNNSSDLVVVKKAATVQVT